MQWVRRLSSIVYFLLAVLSLGAQDSSRLTLSAYIEPYYTYDFSKPSTHTRPGFVYSHNRTGEVTINLALLRLAYQQQRTRGSVGIMAGTYANANLAAEPGVLKNLFEAIAIQVGDHSIGNTVLDNLVILGERTTAGAGGRNDRPVVAAATPAGAVKFQNPG